MGLNCQVLDSLAALFSSSMNEQLKCRLSVIIKNKTFTGASCMLLILRENSCNYDALKEINNEAVIFFKKVYWSEFQKKGEALILWDPYTLKFRYEENKINLSHTHIQKFTF